MEQNDSLNVVVTINLTLEDGRELKHKFDCEYSHKEEEKLIIKKAIYGYHVLMIPRFLIIGNDNRAINVYFPKDLTVEEAEYSTLSDLKGFIDK